MVSGRFVIRLVGDEVSEYKSVVVRLELYDTVAEVRLTGPHSPWFFDTIVDSFDGSSIEANIGNDRIEFKYGPNPEDLFVKISELFFKAKFWDEIISEMYKYVLKED